MRIAVDLQAAQGARRDSGVGQDALAFALAIARNRNEHDVLIVLNGDFPETIEPIRARFDGLLPQRNIRVWHGVGPCGVREAASAWPREVTECMREAILAGLQPDWVVVSDIFGGYGDEAVASIGKFAPQMPTCALLHEQTMQMHSQVHLGCNPSFARHHATQAAYLGHAAAWLALADVPACMTEDLNETDRPRIEVLNQETWDHRARRAIALFEELRVGSAEPMKPDGADALRARLVEAIAAIVPPTFGKTEFAPIARAIATTFPSPRSNQILVDVSEIVRSDARSGIQRVTRSILKEFLLSPPAGYTVQPVYATPTSNGYFYARSYAARILSRDQHEPDGDEVEYQAGDIFLGLDLQHRTLIKQRDYLARLRQEGVKVYVAVYDLLPITMPQHFALDPQLHSQWLEVVTDLDGAVCDSRTVADEVLAWLDTHGRERLRPFEVNWFHQGSDIESSVPTFGMPDDAQLVLDRLAAAPSFLMVSTVEPRKGHRQTLDAFEQIWAHGKDVTLVIVGRQGWKVDELAARLRGHRELGTRLFWLDGISDEYLEKVYAASTCLVASSEGEGFGLPIVEAARHHLPIIARDLPVFREIAGEHAFYFSGLASRDLAVAVEEWLSLNHAGRAPQSSGIAWLTWQQSAEQLRKIISGEQCYKRWMPRKNEDFAMISNTDGATSAVPAPKQEAQPQPPWKQDKQVADLAAEVAQLRQLLAAAQADLALVRASSSWRLTAPLRALVTFARRGMGALRRAAASTRKGSQPRPLKLKERYPLRDAWYDDQSPEVSLIVLNFNKPAMTLECLDSLWEHTQGYRYEIVLVDNGSTPENFRMLAPAAAGARLLRLEVNRFFGEGNNLGFEVSRGRYVVFLNNDITATAGWLEPIIRRLEDDPTIGATGPKLVSPEGVLQEAGAGIRLDGADNRYGRGGDPNDPAYAVERDVTYISAAALAMRRETFEQVLGFDLCYEPAYYEDVDLCLKVGQLGLRVTYCPESCIVHHENATSKELKGHLKLDSLVLLNRDRFLARWRPVLTGEQVAVSGLVPPLAPPPRHRPGLPAVLLYTPYNLVPGGGERYLLTIAAGLAEVSNVTLVTPDPFSQLRLRTMGRELSLDLNDVHITTLDATKSEAFDVMVAMGNEALPAIAGKATHNFYICQFPFPAPQELLDARRKNADGYEQVIVYSPFVQRHYARALQALGMPLPKIAIVSPPAPLAMDATTSGKKPMILGVGRFFVGGHAKRQDLMIEAFRQLAALRPEAELHLAGSLPPENEFRAYFAELKRKAAGLNVHFHPNVSPEHLAKLYGEASLYWHMAGYGVDEATEAYRCEHFGITVVEAMSAGCIALVVNRGGPPQTVDHGATGYAFETLDELVNLSSRILALPSDDEGIMRMRAAAIDASRKYAPEHFVAEVRKLLRLSGSVGAQGGRDAAPELQERAISAAAN